jgi:glycosyltransferase involved in cell wall biosynthesis
LIGVPGVPSADESFDRARGADRVVSQQDFGAALFILPTYSTHREAIDAFKSTAVGLTSALRSWFGTVDILTPLGLFGTIQQRPMPPATSISPRIVARSLPRSLRVLFGDARAVVRAGRFATTASKLPLDQYDLIVRLHRRFVNAGQHMARAAPLVLKVEAIETREEREWGVRRPGWARLTESVGERRLFRGADLLLPISTQVDEQLDRIGIPAQKRVVLPSGVDPTRFSPGTPDPRLMSELRMVGRQRVGWVGGFRPFHGLELLPAFADLLHRDLPHAVLYLIGTGPLRREIERAMTGRTWVRFVGAVPHEEIPRWLRCFDVAILPSTTKPFHYSPLKFYEYLGCGIPVVASRVGDIEREVMDGEEALLVAPGDSGALAGGVRAVLTNPALRRRLALSGRRKAESDFSWHARASSLMDAICERGLLPTPATL